MKRFALYIGALVALCFATVHASPGIMMISSPPVSFEQAFIEFKAEQPEPVAVSNAVTQARQQNEVIAVLMVAIGAIALCAALVQATPRLRRTRQTLRGRHPDEHPPYLSTHLRLGTN